MLLVAERSRGEQGATGTGRGDGQIMMSGGEPFQGLLGVAEGGTQRETLAVLARQLRERGQCPLGGELRWPGQMQGAY